MLPADDFNPPVGTCVELEPGIRRIVAPNPSPMTYRGTNTYLVGTTDLAVIDPGPDDPRHLRALQDALLPGQTVSHILVTHAHLDHSPLARTLAQATGAKVLAFGPATAGRSAVMQSLVDSGFTGGGEGIDTAFEPDDVVTDGERIDGTGWTLDVIHTPGHLGNHICIGLGDACFTADHVMGWASSLVSPPDGDLTDFMASCARLAARPWRVFYPGHGDRIDTPAARLEWLVSHRKGREAAILQALRSGPSTAANLAQSVYVDTPNALLPAATRNVLAHLIDLTGQGVVTTPAPLGADSLFSRVQD
ncbi:MAG: MBL fold metallo-hydrolase, partial [Tateyamaria sp.]